MKIKKIIIILILVFFMVLFFSTKSHAVLQSKPVELNQAWITVPGPQFTAIREMEKTGGTLGLNTKINTTFFTG